MPSTSPAQAKLMSAIAHGWHPAGASHLPPPAVAKEFHEADKKAGKYMHYKADGGKVSTVLDALHKLAPLHESLGTADAHEMAARKSWLAQKIAEWGGDIHNLVAPRTGQWGWHTTDFDHTGKVVPATDIDRAGWQDHVQENLDMHKAEGGKVGTLVNLGRGLMDRIEGAFHNPYTANPDQVRQDIARYWHMHQPAPAPPAMIAAPAPVKEPSIDDLTAQLHELASKGMAEGGPVRHRVRTLPRTDQSAGLKMDPLQLISHAADRVSAAVGDDPHHMLARIAGGLTSQIAGLSPQGTAQYGRVPGIVDETKALPAGLTDLGTGLAALEGAGADAAAAKGFHSPVVSMVQALRDKLASMHDKYGDLAPKWSRDAEARTNQLHDAVHKQMGLTPAHGFAENAAEAGGMMMGQIPVIGEEEKAASMLAKLAKSPIEWLSPSIRPKLSNYAAGTLAGGALGTAADPNVPTPQVADNSMPIEERFE